MSEENGFDVLREEINNLEKRVNRQETYIVMLAVFVIILVLFNAIVNSSGFVYIVLIAVLIIPIAMACKMLEKKGI